MIRQDDPRGHAVFASTPESASACIQGMERYCHWRADAMGYLDDAIKTDSAAAMPRLAKAWILQLGRSASFASVIKKLADEAEAAIQPEDERAAAFLKALRLAVAGDGVAAGTGLQLYLHDYPTDLFAHRITQFEMFWNGRSRWMREVVEAAAPAWSADLPGYGDFLACRAFAAEETGDYGNAERFGRDSVAIARTDAWGTHAVAHVLVMRGDVDAGSHWLEDLCGQWSGANQIRHHLWWHLCLFLLERGEHERILTLLTTEIRNPESPLVQAVPDATIDIQNVASMLLRLELRGVDVGDGWAVLADICAGRVSNHAHAFSNAHDMMVLSATGQFDLARRMIDSMREMVAKRDSTLANAYRLAGIPVAEAILAHRQRRYDDVLEWLLPARHDLPLLGGSHAQRDLFYQILFDAAMQTGKRELAQLLVREAELIGFVEPQDRTLYANAA
jgi:hypothetical protein